MKTIIGVITNTFGIKGEIKIKSMTDFDRFEIGKKVYALVNGQKVDLIIEKKREHKGVVYVLFEKYYDINEISFLKGQTLYSDEDIRSELSLDEFLFKDLINMEAITDTNEIIGQVVDVQEVTQGHLLVIKKNNKKYLVPFRKEFVGEIKDGKITIYPIEGLI